MYNQYLKVLPAKTGKGVFTTTDIPSNSPIVEITGDIYSGKTYEALPKDLKDILYRVGKNLWVGISGSFGDYLNHSCKPNCFLHIVGSRIILYSMYVIKSGTELTFDYSLNELATLDEWKMNCECGEYNCRKIISGIQYLDPKLVEQYKKKNIVPIFITHDIFSAGW